MRIKGHKNENIFIQDTVTLVFDFPSINVIYIGILKSKQNKIIITCSQVCVVFCQTKCAKKEGIKPLHTFYEAEFYQLIKHIVSPDSCQFDRL